MKKYSEELDFEQDAEDLTELLGISEAKAELILDIIEVDPRLTVEELTEISIDDMNLLLESKNIVNDTTEVTFKNLSDKEIDYYIKNNKVLDKAGAYGIQDWIGMIGVERIKGSYTSVLGLPVPQVTGQILKIINENL